MKELLKLQNGSDIRGVAIGYRDEQVNLTPEIASGIAFGFIKWLQEYKGIMSPFVCVGRDCRLSGEALAEGIIRGLKQAGAKVCYFGLASTPCMYVSTKPEMLNADGAVMITASHLPYNKNGMKFFTKEGGTDKNDVKNILNFVENFTSNKNVDKICDFNDFIIPYSDVLVRMIRQKTALFKPLEGLKIIVDAGNGAGGFFVDKVLITLGADTKGSVFLEPDGRFPNHIPNPENDNIMEDFCAVVKEECADLGIIFDTDVDRAALVDEKGEPVSRNRLIALMSNIVIIEHPGSIIVTDSVTSTSLKKFIEACGGIHHRFQRGYNNVINEAKRLNAEGKNCALAIETSGHCALRENDFLDDGAYMIIKILIKYVHLKKQGLTISDILKDYHEPVETKELRPYFKTEDFKTYGNQLLEAFIEFAATEEGWSIEIPNYEGIRVNCDKDHGDGWLLMRMSLHDPQLPINIESDSKGGVKKIEKRLMEFLKNYNLDFK